MKKVLIVDDQADIRRLVRWSLEIVDVEVHEATDGLDALRCCAELKPDLMLVDVMMPGDIDGLEVCRRVKASNEMRGTRVVLLSARGQVTDIEAGVAAGADAYMVKPFSPQRLVETAEKLLSAAA